jgi:putative addiction module component (TIGR02574 family)
MSLMESLGIDRLSVEDRVRLIEEVEASLAEVPLTEAQERELVRRLAAHEANPDDVVPWEVVRAEARARFGR